MFAQKLSLNTKLLLGFLAMALVVLVVGGMGLFAVTRTSSATSELGEVRLASQQTVYEINGAVLTIIETERSSLLPGLSLAQRAEQTKRMATAEKRLNQLAASFAGQEATGKEATLRKAFQKALKAWLSDHNQVAELGRRINQLAMSNAGVVLANLDNGIREEKTWSTELQSAINYGKQFKGQTDPAQTGLGQWLQSFKAISPQLAKGLEEIKELRSRIYGQVGELNNILGDPARFLEAQEFFEKKIKPVLGKLPELLSRVRKLPAEEIALRTKAIALSQNQAQASYSKVEAALRALLAQNRQLARDTTSQALATASLARIVTMAVAVVGVVLALLLGIFGTRSISKPLRRATGVLTETSTVVLNSGEQVHTASQSLADGSNRQASSLEEVSASMEQMASMTQVNAEKAGQADVMMKESARAVERAGQAMEQLRSAMERIDQASGKTAKIIGTIDEIAFQTNLLALNAAVEAARAGEAGAGFAVVADEVRNLAMRAAEAAGSTTELIDGNIAEIKSGAEMVATADNAFTEVRTGAAKVGDLVAEIATASSEQAQGIDQVNQAMTEMDQITQQNAAIAEESAAAAQELSGQANTMQDAVVMLVALVDGSKAAKPAGREPAPAARPRLTHEPGERRDAGKAKAPAAPAAPAAPSARVAQAGGGPEDEDFQDF